MQDAGRHRGETLRQLREAKPWTQAQLAKASGVSTRTIMRVEAGEETSAETLMSLCAALDIPVSDLVRVASERPPADPAAEPLPRTVPATEPEPLAPEMVRESSLPGWYVSMRKVFVRCSVALSLTGIGMLVGLHVAASAVSPHQAKAAEAMQAAFSAVRTRQINLMAVRYSTSIPPDAPERKWEPWLEQTQASWSSCDREGDGLLSAYSRFVALFSGRDGKCRYVHFDLTVVSRDDTMTEVVVGPTTPRYLKGILGSLTGDPTVRIQAMLTPESYVYSEMDPWFDPRSSGVPTSDDKPSYARIRLSGTR